MGREEQIEEREVLDSIFPEEIKSMYAIAEDYGVCLMCGTMAGSRGSSMLLNCRCQSSFVNRGFREGIGNSNVYDFRTLWLT